jgi:hypothetical protein
MHLNDWMAQRMITLKTPLCAMRGPYRKQNQQDRQDYGYRDLPRIDHTIVINAHRDNLNASATSTY